MQSDVRDSDQSIDILLEVRSIFESSNDQSLVCLDEEKQLIAHSTSLESSTVEMSHIRPLISTTDDNDE